MTEEAVDRHVERMEARGTAQFSTHLHGREPGGAAFLVDEAQEARFERGIEQETLGRGPQASLGGLHIARHFSRAAFDMQVAGERRQAGQTHQDEE